MVPRRPVEIFRFCVLVEKNKKMHCPFKCRAILRKKHAVLECAECDAITVCCLLCATDNEVCPACVSKRKAARKLPPPNAERHIKRIVRHTFESGIAFSDVDWLRAEPELWQQHSNGVEVQTVNADVMFLEARGKVGKVRSVWLPDEEFDLDGDEINGWAQTFDFDKAQLATVLHLEEDTWIGTVELYVYTVEQKYVVRATVEEQGFCFHEMLFDTAKSARLTMLHDQDADSFEFVGPAPPDLPLHVADAARSQAKLFADGCNKFAFYAYW